MNAPRLPPVSLTCELSPLAEPWQPEGAARKVISCTLVPVYFSHFLSESVRVYHHVGMCATLLSARWLLVGSGGCKGSLHFIHKLPVMKTQWGHVPAPFPPARPYRKVNFV